MPPDPDPPRDDPELFEPPELEPLLGLAFGFDPPEPEERLGLVLGCELPDLGAGVRALVVSRELDRGSALVGVDLLGVG